MASKPITITQIDTEDYVGYTPAPYLVVGSIPGAEGGLVDSVTGGTGITVDATDPVNPEVSLTDTYVETVAAGAGITVDATDPANPEVSLTDVYVETVAAGANISVDATDPAAPEVSLDLTGVAGYSAGATQTLKHITGTLTWVTDA